METDTEQKALAALKDIALEGVKEQRRARRWNIFFRLLFWGFVLVVGYMLLKGKPDEASFIDASSDKVTAAVDIKGVIADDADASADIVIASLQKAFENKSTKGVILRINSPGGSPVQAGQINDEIKRLKALHKEIPVYAVVSDICASGGYYIAVAADKIYADKASLVGSIGVRMDSFGFVDTMKMVGVERRLFTAGANKGMLDPFLPLNEQQVAHVKQMLDVTHQQFIKVVKDGRGDRLANNPDLFSGLFWTGETAVGLGLVDKLADERYVAREVIGAEKIVNFTTEKDLFERLSSRVSSQVKLWLDSSFSTELHWR